MNENNVQKLQRTLQKTRTMLRDQALTSTILRSIADIKGTDHTLRIFCELFRAHGAYLLFMQGKDIITMDFFSADSALSFRPPQDMHLEQDPPQNAQKRESISKSLFGDVHFESSIVYPLRMDAETYGILEIGWAAPTISGDLFGRFQRTMLKIEGAFLLLYDHELKAKQLYATRRSLKTTRSSLEQSATRFEVIFNDSKDLIVSIDRQGRILEINPAGCTMLGYTPDEAPQILPLVSPDLDFVGKMLDRLSVMNDTEVVLTTKDGQALFGIASFSSREMVGLDVPPIYGIIKNITERVKLQQELWAVNMELSNTNDTLKSSQSHIVQQEKLASIGQLAAGVAHEINNPLAFVTSNFHSLEPYLGKLFSYIHYLEQRIGATDPELVSERQDQKIDFVTRDIHDIMKESNEGLERIMNIVRSLKDFSRIDSAGQISAVDLNRALENTVTVARNSWKYVAEIKTDFQLGHAVECSASEINQVFLNIIVNSAQAIEGQKRSSPGTMRIETREEAGRAVIRISDDGPGIPASIRDRIFEPFFTTKEIGQGTGLGLSICYDIIVKRHKGSIHFENNVESGTCFVIRLPLTSAATAVDAIEIEPGAMPTPDSLNR